VAFSSLINENWNKGGSIVTEQPTLISVSKVEDARGYFQKFLDPRKLCHHGIAKFQALEMFSTSTKKYGIRGMHIQVSPHQSRKIVWVGSGEILDVLVDVISGEVYTFELHENSELVLYIPPNFAHGFQAMADGTQVNYVTDARYNKECDTGFNPFSFGFKWPKPVSVLSERDQKLMDFEGFCERT
jgi:dTDP-4-dehydrorhamnose 3,5-epimerase